MKKRYAFLVVVLLTVTLRAQMRAVSFYAVPPVRSEIQIDGRLDEAAWGQAPVHSAYYQYFVPNPPPGKLKTEHRLLYDERGLYLAITNFDEHPEKLRRNVTDRDNSHLWTDDCAEIYIDSYGNGIGYRRFVVNALGTVGDMMRLDGAVTLDEWSGDGWFARVGIEADRWVIEAFFPWADLGKKPEAGDVWMFCHVRYAYTSGSFLGVTSSAGGNYSNTGDFGYLCFQGQVAQASADGVGAMLQQRVAPPWGLVIGEQLVYHVGQGVQTAPLVERIAHEEDQAAVLGRQVTAMLQQNPGLPKAFAADAEGHGNILATDASAGINRLTMLLSLQAELRALLARLRLELEFN